MIKSETLKLLFLSQQRTLKMAPRPMPKLTAQDGSPGIDKSHTFSHTYVTRRCCQCSI